MRANLEVSEETEEGKEELTQQRAQEIDEEPPRG
jgi:hypothetical protein